MIGAAWRLAVLGTALLTATPAFADMNCSAPEWQRLNETQLGVSVDVTSDMHIRYWLDEESFLNSEVTERGRSGAEIGGRCSSFNFSVVDFGEKQISDPTGLLKANADGIASGGLKDFKLLRNKALTFQGLPAREVIFSFTVEYLGTPASHRYLLVTRGNRFYTFGWVWGDSGSVPDDSTRIFDSIRFTNPVADPNARSRAMLEQTIRLYWLRESYPKTVYLSPALREIADPKRAAESKIVEGYGYAQKIDFLRMDGKYRVFRIEHSKAIVDWWTIDDGRQITALTWKKVRDIAP